MSCTKEEIEIKRLAALQKRQNKLSSSTHQNNTLHLPNNSFSPRTSYNFDLSKAGPVKRFSSCKSFHPYSKTESRATENNIPPSKVVSGTVYLISEDRFEVNPSEFCTPLINVFKTLPSRNYDSKSKLWNFSVNDYQELMAKVSPLSPHIVLGPIPPFVLKILREDVMDPNNVDLSPVEATLRNKLMPFQEEGVRFGIARRGRCMIADDMGLGKTFQALAIASYYKHNWPVLIVTTSSMRETWQNKIHELLPSTPLMNIVTLSSGKDTQLVADRQTEVVIVSYKISGMYTDLLRNKKFGVVIIDESHFLKSPKARCTVSLTKVTEHSQRIVLLSGTPALSRPIELYTQLAILRPAMFLTYNEYGKRYCAGKQTNFGWDMTGQSNLQELQVVLHKKFLIRRTKEQVLTTLEEKTRESVILDHSLLQFSKDEETGLHQMAETYKSTRSSDKHAALITFFAESAKVKIPAICKYIKQLVSSYPRKFLVFAHHKTMVEAICETLDSEGTGYICIVGSTPSHCRTDLVDRFQHTESCRCAVLSITAANSGITLTAASLVLFAELHWNPGILTQAESRAHRIGQQGSVCVRYLLATGTADDYMWPMLQNKLNVLNNVGLSRDTFEDTTTSHQESKTNITQYLTPRIQRNRNDYIPGTNIRKDSINSERKNNTNSEQLKNNTNSEQNDTNSGQNNTNSEQNNTNSGQNNTNSEQNNANSELTRSNLIGDRSNNADISLNCGSEIDESFVGDLTFCDILSSTGDQTFFDVDEDDELMANIDL